MSVSGRVGDRLFSVKTTTREQTGEAIITARVDNANYKHPKLLGKITYMGKKEIKSNLWWRSD